MSAAKFLFSLLCALCSMSVGLAGENTLEMNPKEKVHLFLLAGQSNMAGRGKVEAEDRKIHPRIFALSKEGKWVPAVDPLHWDKKSAGVGLGKSFALELVAEDEEIVIGLVPTACGGSPISTWEPGGFHDQTKSHPYDDAVKRMKRAMKDGVLKGVLWHQGESDSNPKRAGQYEKSLKGLIGRLRKELEAEEVPFIIGQLGQFSKKPWSDGRKTVNAAQQAVAKELSAVGFVKSDGLVPMADNTHFDSKSLREFGRRYAEMYRKVAGP